VIAAFRPIAAELGLRTGADANPKFLV